MARSVPPVRTRWWPRVIVSVLLATTLLGEAGAREFLLGACLHLGQGRGGLENTLKQLRSGGFNAIRDDVYWSRIEKTPGELAVSPPLRTLTELTRRAGDLQALYILAYGNPAYDNNGLVVSDEGRAAFARYAGFVASSTPDAFGLEVWNEWNSGFGSNPRTNSGSAADYVKLLAAARTAIHASRPGTRVIAGATAGLDLKWTDAFIAAGGAPLADAFSVHSYTLFKQRDAPEIALYGLDQIEQKFVAATRAPMPIYITEMGWPSYAGRHGVDEAKQADYLIRFLFLARTRPWIQGVWLYDLVDDGNDPASMEHHFGMYRADGSDKPAISAIRRRARDLTQGTDFSYRFAAPADYFVEYTVQGERRGVGWRVEAAALVSNETVPYGNDRKMPLPDEVKQALSSADEGAPLWWRLDSRGSWVKSD